MSSNGNAARAEEAQRQVRSVQSWVSKMKPGLEEIAAINAQVRMLGLNARIEATRAGLAGKAFAVVAEEMGKLSRRTATYTEAITRDIDAFLAEMTEVELRSLGHRLSDLALSTIDILDRNLYERSCDVRWWATETALWECCQSGGNPDAAGYASARLATILRSYTVYSDLVLVDAKGKLVAGAGRAAEAALGRSFADAPWFKRALELGRGSEFSVQDVSVDSLVGVPAPIYSAAVREQGRDDGHPIGVLAIAFDWPKQSQLIVQSVRLEDGLKQSTRCVIVNREGVVIASSDGAEVLSESLGRYRGIQRALQGEKGFTVEDGVLVAYAHTPGYETYAGLGWACALLHELGRGA